MRFYSVDFTLFLKLINPILHHININAKYVLIINVLSILL